MAQSLLTGGFDPGPAGSPSGGEAANASAGLAPDTSAVMPGGAQLSTVMLLIIGIVGTTVAPWQLFFQQSYIIDKRITPRFINYERADLWIGIGIVVVGAAAMFGFSAAVFAGHPEFGNFTDAGGVAAGLGKYVSHLAGDLFAIALLDASIIGASAVGLATAYASQYIPGAPSDDNVRMGKQAMQEWQEVLNRDPSNLNAIDGIGSILYNMASTPFNPKKMEE